MTPRTDPTKSGVCIHVYHFASELMHMSETLETTKRKSSFFRDVSSVQHVNISLSLFPPESARAQCRGLTLLGPA